jgi:hypothetical protein
MLPPFLAHDPAQGAQVFEMRQRLEGGGELHGDRTVEIEAENDAGDLVRRTRLPANRSIVFSTMTLLRQFVIVLVARRYDGDPLDLSPDHRPYVTHHTR